MSSNSKDFKNDESSYAYKVADRLLRRPTSNGFAIHNNNSFHNNYEKCPFVTKAICSTSNVFFTQTETPSSAIDAFNTTAIISTELLPSKSPSLEFETTKEEEDPSYLLYHSTLTSNPPITGNYTSPSSEITSPPTFSGTLRTSRAVNNVVESLERYVRELHEELGIITITGARRRRRGENRRREREGLRRAEMIAEERASEAVMAVTCDGDGASNTNNLRGDLTPSEEETYHIITHLTSIVLPNNTNDNNNTTLYPSISSARNAFQNLGQSIPKKVCQYRFKPNDIFWVCRTCQSDETRVLCNECFTHSNHEGHDVEFYRAQAGGCCDCGDPDAFDRRGFCPRHGVGATGDGKEGGGLLDARVEQRVKGVVMASTQWLADVFAKNVEKGYRRGMGAMNMEIDEDVGNEDEDGYDIDKMIATCSEATAFTNTPLRKKDNSSGTLLPAEDDTISEDKKNDIMIPTIIANDECKFDPQAASASKSRSSTTTATATATTTDISTDMSNLPQSSTNQAVSDINAVEIIYSDHNIKDKNNHQSSIFPIFNPEAASTSKSLSPSRRSHRALHSKPYLTSSSRAPAVVQTISPAQKLGQLGSRENGLFLVLHSDFHSVDKISTALHSLYTDSGSNTNNSTTANIKKSPDSPASTQKRRHLNDLTYQIASLFQNTANQSNSNSSSSCNNNVSVGDLILYGTHELMAELGLVLSQCWKDFDPQACTRFGALMLEKARILWEDHGLICSIKTWNELWLEIRAKSVIEFLGMLSESCDPLCNQVSLGLGGGDINRNDLVYTEKKTLGHNNKGYLASLLQSDLKLPRSITASWQALLLTLLAIPNFKVRLANAYCDTYRTMSADYARGVGNYEKSSYALSVQFLNRVTYVEDLVVERDLLGCLSQSLLETLSVATLVDDSSCNEYEDGEEWLLLRNKVRLLNSSRTSSVRKAPSLDKQSKSQSKSCNPILNSMHIVLLHGRYIPCIDDLKCVLNPSMARLFCSLPTLSSLSLHPKDQCCALNAWIGSLSLIQNMDGQNWRSFSMSHVEIEPKGWENAFALSITVGNMFDRLLNWDDDDPFPIMNTGNCIKSSKLLSSVEFTHYILLKGVSTWQKREMVGLASRCQSNLMVPELCCSTSLPMSTVAVRHGTHLVMDALPVAQGHTWTFHLPLHRFVAASLRKVARRPYRKANGELDGIEHLLFKLNHSQYGNEMSNIVSCNKEELNLLFQGLLEFPLIVLSRAAQIRSELWKRNGPGMFDQVKCYTEAPFCKFLRDADLVLIQFALLGFNSTNKGCQFDDLALKCPKFRCAHFVNLFLHRLGIFEFAGFANDSDPDSDSDVPSEKTNNNNTTSKAEIAFDGGRGKEELNHSWTYTVTRDVFISNSLMEGLLHILIILITELPLPPAKERGDHARQVKQRLRREVVHQLVSGPKMHSELAEVQCVLSLRDDSVFREEGNLGHPNASIGTKFESVLQEVAECQSSQGNPDTWELRREIWSEYDPAFFHISLKSHQDATENRPKWKKSSKLDPSPFVPLPPIAHESYLRLRRDITSDSVVIALIYRTLHVHCRVITSSIRKKTRLRGKAAYDTNSMNETLLARAIHLLTLGAYAWDEEAVIGSGLDSTPNLNSTWQIQGGGDMGSIFYEYSSVPTQYDWIERVLLRDAKYVMDSRWYDEEENALKLLDRLANEGGSATFSAQDASIKAGAAWLCKFARKHSKVASLFIKDSEKKMAYAVKQTAETDIQRRSREARERALQKIKEDTFKFDIMMKGDEDSLSDNDDKAAPTPSIAEPISEDPSPLQKPLKSESAVNSRQDKQFTSLKCTEHVELTSHERIHPESASRLLSDRPQCIICADDGLTTFTAVEKRKRGYPRKPKDEKILAFCAHVQASTVLKGGGGMPYPIDYSTPLSSLSNFVGTHISLCGHVVHTTCLEAHLKDLAHRKDRNSDQLEAGKRGDFQCPMCRQLSNCLIPFIDVGSDWARRDGRKRVCDTNGGAEEKCSLNFFLSNSKLWAIRNDNAVVWNGRCSFLPAEMEGSDSYLPCVAKGVKPLVKKDLYIAWTAAMETPQVIRKRKASSESLNLPSYESNNLSSAQGYLTYPLILPSNHISNMTTVWRRVMDQCADVSYKADLRRLGEDRLQLDYGEFRHYLVEKFAFNDENRTAGSTIVDWPECVMPHMRKELSREKLISKLLQTIQSFTYSCCAEELECKRLSETATDLDGALKPSVSDIWSKYGVYKFACGGKFLILSDPSASEEGGLQVFCGRIGRLRYLALAIMAATSAVSREVVQLALDLPDPFSRVSTCESEDADILIKSDDRSPLVFPLLCGHILTHVVAAMCAVCGQERTCSDISGYLSSFPDFDADAGKEKSSFGLDSVDDCKQFIQLGFLARLLQVLLGCFQNENKNGTKLSFNMCESIIHALSGTSEKSNDGESMYNLTPWEKDCCQLLQRTLLEDLDSPSLFEANIPNQFVNKGTKLFFDACEKARSAGVTFLCNIGLILQVLAPTRVSDFIDMNDEYGKGSSLEDLMILMGVKPVKDCLSSKLVCDVINNWYKNARSSNLSTDRAKLLDCTRTFRDLEWPLVELENNTMVDERAQTSSLLLHNLKKSVPFLRGCNSGSYNRLNGPCILALPTSYTDLYAALMSVLPDSELTAVCVVCGEVIDGKGKGLCTKHAFKCGGGSGIFYLLQECRGLILHKEKAAHVYSLYVDSHGETPKYCRRPLNLDKSRYNFFRKLWFGHLLRQEVILERSKAREIIDNNFY